MKESAWPRHGRAAASSRSGPWSTTLKAEGTHATTDAAVVAVFRDEAGRLTAALMRVLGDFALAEEVVQDSLVAALEKWPEQGIPDKPGAWLMTTARRRAIHLLRRHTRYRQQLALLERSALTPEPSEADDRPRLIFTCCHPALSQEAQVALTLRAVVGFTTAAIGTAFLVAEATVAQRIVRAKRKIVDARIAYRVPEGAELAGRLDEGLSVLYLIFNKGYFTRGAPIAMRRDIADDALWLTRLVATLMPDQPEVLGLLVLMKLNLARSEAPFDAAGEMVLLPDPNHALGDHAAIADGVATPERAGPLQASDPYYGHA